jgi:NitT/TauT family transport system substrate-binding protein
MTQINRRQFNTFALGSAALTMAGAAGMRTARAQGLKELLVAEPGHLVGYLPLYAAIARGYFRDEGLNVKVLTVESGAGHTNAVLTRQAFAFIGGPEHNAYARAKGAELRAIVNCVNKGNVYLVAAKGQGPRDRNFGAWAKGKRFATGFFGGTPNSISRFLLAEWGLDPRMDVTLTESSSSAILAAVKTRNADLACISEPQLTQGIRQGIWDEPFFNVPKELGEYTYSTLNVLKDSIDNDPKTCAGFVRAMMRGLKLTYENPKDAIEVARKEFPTMASEDLAATVDRAFADELWSRDGKMSPRAWSTGQRVVQKVGLLKIDVPFEGVIDTRFLA